MKGLTRLTRWLKTQTHGVLVGIIIGQLMTLYFVVKMLAK